MSLLLILAAAILLRQEPEPEALGPEEPQVPDNSTAAASHRCNDEAFRPEGCAQFACAAFLTRWCSYHCTTCKELCEERAAEAEEKGKEPVLGASDEGCWCEETCAGLLEDAGDCAGLEGECEAGSEPPKEEGPPPGALLATRSSPARAS